MKHVFVVRAVDADGNRSADARYKWVVRKKS